MHLFIFFSFANHKCLYLVTKVAISTIQEFEKENDTLESWIIWNEYVCQSYLIDSYIHMYINAYRNAQSIFTDFTSLLDHVDL